MKSLMLILCIALSACGGNVYITELQRAAFFCQGGENISRIEVSGRHKIVYCKEGSWYWIDDSGTQESIKKYNEKHKQESENKV